MPDASPRRHIKEMRQRLGLDENDTKRDAEIEGMSPLDRLRLLCGWHLGDAAWAWTFLDWARDAGFAIPEKDDA